jgi:hypothetical protein
MQAFSLVSSPHADHSKQTSRLSQSPGHVQPIRTLNLDEEESHLELRDSSFETPLKKPEVQSKRKRASPEHLGAHSCKKAKSKQQAAGSPSATKLKHDEVEETACELSISSRPMRLAEPINQEHEFRGDNEAAEVK